MRGPNYFTQDRLGTHAVRVRFSGDILWLGVSGLTTAAVMGILCWPISAMLSPRASSVGSTLASGYGGSWIAPPVAPLTTPGEGVERPSIVASLTPITAPTEPNGTKLSLLDPNADRPLAEPPTDRAMLTPVPRAPQQNPLAAAPPPSRQLGSPRTRQLHQQARPDGPSQKSALVPQ
jgi:hypothetical protein